MRANVGLLWTR